MFPERLKALRTERNLTQEELSKMVNVSSKTVGAWERGTRQPSIEAITKLAEIFNVTTDYLLGQNQTPKWADQRDTLDLKKFIDEDAGMTYDGDNLTEEELEQLNVAFTQIFWKRRKTERKIARDAKEE